MPSDEKPVLGAFGFFAFLVVAAFLGGFGAITLDRKIDEYVESKRPPVPVVRPSNCQCRKTGLVLPSGAMLPEVSR